MEVKRPIDTKRKKIFRGRALWGFGAGASDGLGDELDADWVATLSDADWDLSVGLSPDFSGLSGGGGTFLTGTTGVCFLWIWPRTTAQAGGL